MHVPVPAETAHFAVYKITKRRDEDITAALGAFHLTLGAGRHGRRRSASPMAAWRRRRSGRRPSRRRCSASRGREATVEAAIAAYAGDFTPLTDMRATAEYRLLAAQEPAAALLLETTGTKAPVQVSRSVAA